MRTKPLRVCLGFGGTSCPELTRESRCSAHEAEYRAAHPRRSNVYGTKRWKALRRQVLREEPWCQADCTELATEVDHVVPIAAGGNPWDRRNLQALCKRCHSRKTAAEVWRS